MLGSYEVLHQPIPTDLRQLRMQDEVCSRLCNGSHWGVWIPGNFPASLPFNTRAVQLSCWFYLILLRCYDAIEACTLAVAGVRYLDNDWDRYMSKNSLSVYLVGWLLLLALRRFLHGFWLQVVHDPWLRGWVWILPIKICDEAWNWHPQRVLRTYWRSVHLDVKWLHHCVCELGPANHRLGDVHTSGVHRSSNPCLKCVLLFCDRNPFCNDHCSWHIDAATKCNVPVPWPRALLADEWMNE